jgi:hypothetical protein
MDREMVGRKIGRNGPIAWPPKSPDLICQVQINDLQQLKACIRDAVATVTPNMIQATWNEVEYRLDICRATKGAHIEIY